MKRNASFVESFKYAGSGVWYVLRTQRNFRVHIFATILVICAGMWTQLSIPSWAILISLIGAVLVTELFNTVVEVLVDLVSPDYHPLAKWAKDIAAGAVLVMSITSVVVGLLILGPPLLAHLGF